MPDPQSSQGGTRASDHPATVASAPPVVPVQHAAAKVSRHPYAVGVVLDHYGNLNAEQVRARLRYSSFVSLPQRYLYVEVPKAACTSMKQLLRRLEHAPPIKLFSGGLRESRRDMFVHARENVPLPSLLDLDDRQQREVLESSDFLRMTVVRNPYTRLISAWRNKVMLCEPGYERVYVAIRGRLPEPGQMQLLSFAEFVAYVSGEDLTACDPHWSLQTAHAFTAALDFNLIGKTEAMADLLARFARHLGLAQTLLLTESNASIAAAFSPCDETLAAKIYSLYKPDFDALGYRRDDWPKGPAPALSSREQELFDEIVERNLVVSGLYDRLQAASAELRALRLEADKANRWHWPDWTSRLLALARGGRTLLSRVPSSLLRGRG